METFFDFDRDYLLEDDHVLLRPLELSDTEYLMPFALQEPDTWQYSLLPAAGEEGMKNYVAMAVAARQNKTEYPFIVYDKQLRQYAGSTRFYDMQLPLQRLQLGYTWYGRRHRGTGLNKHCKFLLLSFAFETMGMERVEFRADAANTVSINAMKSIGCIEEGILRSHGPRPDGSRRDSIVLSILKTEWNTAGKELLHGKL
jgi:N-acetyltransferase